MSYSPLLVRLIDALRCMPGVGRKSAQRIAFHLLERDRDGASALAAALADAADYDVVVTNDFGSVTSDAAVLTVADGDLTFTNITDAAGITGLHTVPDSTVVDFRATWMSGGAAAEDFDGDGVSAAAPRRAASDPDEGD